MTLSRRHHLSLAALLTAASALIPAAFAQSTPAQTAPTHHSARATTATRSATTRPAASHAANPADNPPNVPRVAGLPKPLYTLRYIDTLIGTGQLSAPQKYYTVRYTGWLTNGTKFDSSDDHPGKEPITFPYGARRVIPGWDTGFEGMHVGGKRRLYIPYQLAYGLQGRPPVIPAKSDLIFDIELVAMSDTPPQPAPEAAPANPSAASPSSKPSSPSSSAPASGQAPSGTTLPTGNTATPTSPAPANSTPPPAGTPSAPAGTPPPPTKPETAPQR